MGEDREEIGAELDQDLVWNEPEETRAGKERSKPMFLKQAEITDEERWDDYL